MKAKFKKPDSKNNISKYLNGYWSFFWLMIIIIAVYYKSLFYQYSYFDDHVLILNRLDFFKHLSNFGKIFSQEAFNNYSSKFYYRPLLTATFFIDGWMGGGKLLFFHLSNIIYHVLTCWMVLILLKKLTQSSVTSFLLTAIFAVQPVIVQVVVWIPGRNESVLTIILILSFLSFLKYLENNQIIDGILSLFFFILALLIKELTVFFPMAVIAYLLIFKKESKSKLILMSIGWIFLILMWAIIRNNVLGKALGGTNLSEMIMTVIMNLPAIPAYIGKIFIPYGLSVYPNLKDMNIPIVIGSIFILLIGLSFFYKPANKKLMIFGLLWFMIFLVPGLIKATNMSEHRIYFPMVGMLIFMAGFIGEVKTKLGLIFISVFLVFVSINISFSKNFKNRLTLWQQAVKSSPSSAFNSNNLGAMYFLENDFVNAEKYFRKAVELSSIEPLANGNLGLVLMNTNRLNEAEAYLLKENVTNPSYDNAYLNLGILYLKQGNNEAALKYLAKTISINPGNIDAYKYMINYYQFTKQPLLAQQVFDAAKANGINF